MTDRAWWHVSDDESTNEWVWNRSDDQEDEARLLDWHCEIDTGGLIVIPICLNCGNPLTNPICEVCE